MGKTIGLTLALKDKCSPQINKIADSMGLTEKEAKKANAQIQKLSKDLSGGFKTAAVVCTAALAAMGVASQQLVMHTIESTSRINDLSDRIGISKKSFQEWDWIMAQNGGEVEALQVGIKKLIGNIDKANGGNKEAVKTFKTLGVSIKDTNGKLKSQEQVFDEVAIALQKMPDGINKAKLAGDLFGKSGMQLMPILKNNATSISDLKKQYESLGITISDEMIEAGDNLGDTIDSMKASFSAMGSFLGSEFVPVIQDIADTLLLNMPKIKSAVLPVIQGLGNVINFALQNMSALIPIATGLVSTFIAFNAINGVISTIQTLQAVIKAVSLAQGVWNALMIANPIGVIAVATGILIGGIVLLVQNWDKVTEAVKNAIEAMGKFVGIKADKNVTVKTTSIEENSKSEKPKRNAVGTAFSSGGATLVGEYGKELVNMPRGASVTPTNATQKALSGNGGINVYVTIAGNMIGNNEFLQQMSNIFAKKLQVALAVR